MKSCALTVALLIAISSVVTLAQENVEIEKGNVVFRIDERTEFLRMIFNLAVEDDIEEEYKPCRTTYYDRIQNQFSGYKNHPLIRYVRENEDLGADFSTLALIYEDWENFVFDDRYTQELDEYGVSRAAIDTMKPLLKDLYQKTNFRAFFEENRDYYRQSITGLAKQTADEALFDKVQDFYQSDQNDLQLIAFVELTNNINNKAVTFYNNYNPKERAIVLANFCDLPSESTVTNEVLELDERRHILYHEVSHLFTDELLDRYIGNLVQYQPICEDCNDTQIKDNVDHTIIGPLQALLSYRISNDERGHHFYLNECEDVRKDVYQRLKEYRPEAGAPFEEAYADRIRLIQQSAADR